MRAVMIGLLLLCWSCKGQGKSKETKIQEVNNRLEISQKKIDTLDILILKNDAYGQNTYKILNLYLVEDARGILRRADALNFH